MTESLNKLTLLLSNKEMIAELMKDPEVKVKITDAIIDGLSRRALKLDEMKKQVLDAGKKEIKDMFLEGDSWHSHLKPEYASKIRSIAEDFFNKEARIAAKEALENNKLLLQSILNSIVTPEKIMEMLQASIDKEVRRRFSTTFKMMTNE